MLPHLKRIPNQGRIMFGLGAIVPILLLIIYSTDLNNPEFDKKMDPTGWDMDQAIKAANSSQSLYITLTPFGNGKRDAFFSFIGYVMEIVLTGMYYNLLFNTY